MEEFVAGEILNFKPGGQQVEFQKLYLYTSDVGWYAYVKFLINSNQEIVKISDLERPKPSGGSK